jgi:uncharacterized protein
MRMPPKNSVSGSGTRGSRHFWNPSSRLYNLSLTSLEGLRTPQDPQKSFLLNAQAAESGMHEAVLAMGWFYLNGVGVPEDIRQAKRWYRKSARQGEPMAMFTLGYIAYGQRDFQDALVWFGRARDRGHSASIFWIGKLLWRGHGVPQNKKKAMALFQRAAREKVSVARRVLRFLSRPFSRPTRL